MARWGCTSLVLLLAAGWIPAAGQSFEEESRFRRIEQGIDDIGPLGTSNRMLPVDLRVPIDFTSVYEIIDTPGMLARRAGAITAVFDRSVYDGQSGIPIPPGTVFYIGELPVNLARPGLLADGRPAGIPADPAGARPVGLASAAPASASERLDLRAPPADPSSLVAPPPARPTIWDDEPYRRRRVGELLRSAAWRVREPGVAPGGAGRENPAPAPGSAGD